MILELDPMISNNGFVMICNIIITVMIRNDENVMMRNYNVQIGKITVNI